MTVPPPQAIVNQRPWWLVLVSILGSTLILRVLSFDMLGALLCSLMICLCVVILRDGMRELPKFGLLFGLLCGINFVFYAMPVLGYIISGKSEQHVQPVSSTDYGRRYSHTRELTYTLTVKTMPFFDISKGFMYNAQSVGELLMPIAMLLGTYLGVSAHYEFQSYIVDLLPDIDDDDELGRENGDISTAILGRNEAAAATRASNYGAIFGAATGGVPPSHEPPKNSHKAFSGTAHKLAL